MDLTKGADASITLHVSGEDAGERLDRLIAGGQPDVSRSRVKALIEGRGKPTAGIRIGVRTKGCSGLSYTLEFADKQELMDEVVETEGLKLLIDPKASLFLIGTEMDYEEEKLKQGFVFKNPNEKGRCGCGESFHV